MALLATVQREITLFAAIGLLIGGVDDLLVDIIYGIRRCWRRWTIYSRHQPMTTATLPASSKPGTLAIFIPAWQEGDVIGAMLSQALQKWRTGNYRIFVGAYPNDPETSEAVNRAVGANPHVSLVINPLPGPTTKADCLNTLWSAMIADEISSGRRYKAVVLHDSEDVVHPDELALFDFMMDRFTLVQLPVLPLPSQQSRWIAGHYCDEFAEPNWPLTQFRIWAA